MRKNRLLMWIHSHARKSIPAAHARAEEYCVYPFDVPAWAQRCLCGKQVRGAPHGECRDSESRDMYLGAILDSR